MNDYEIVVNNPWSWLIFSYSHKKMAEMCLKEKNTALTTKNNLEFVSSLTSYHALAWGMAMETLFKSFLIFQDVKAIKFGHNLESMAKEIKKNDDKIDNDDMLDLLRELKSGIEWLSKYPTPILKHKDEMNGKVRVKKDKGGHVCEVGFACIQLSEENHHFLEQRWNALHVQMVEKLRSSGIK